MDLTITGNIPTRDILAGLEDSGFWAFAGSTAHRLMYPYIPFNEGVLASNIEINPTGSGVEIVFLQPYAEKTYYGNFNFRTDRHPLATKEWDKVAFGESFEKPEGEKLLEDMQNYINTIYRD